jgi:5-hydroxyisourate hydrolase-like protein (transthyretin family)
VRRLVAAAALGGQLAVAGVLASSAPAAAAEAAVAKPITAGYQQDLTLRWRLSDSHGAPVAGLKVIVLIRAQRAKIWRAYANAVTDRNGVVKIVARASVSSEFALRHSLTAGHPAVVGPIAVDVSSRVTAALAARAVLPGSPATIAGSVLPAKRGAPVLLQRLVGTTWTHVATTELDNGGRFTFLVKTTTPGRISYRVIKPADSANTAGVGVVLQLLVK